jgi:UDP-2-acetamido-3-amino-2,3-dideoxy-glucuronate N-acetyltransferase
MPAFDSARHPGVQVHESAYVDEPCEIGEGTMIWHFTHVMRGCRIGRRCRIGQNVVIAPEVTLGDNVKVQNNVSIYTGVILENDVFCGPSMVFTNVVNPRSEIPRRDEFRPTIVRCGASLGANSTILCGIEVGRFAFIAAGAVVTRGVEDYALMVGVPARRAGWMCRCGTRLPESDGAGHAVCAACGNEYQVTDDRCAGIREVQDNDSSSAATRPARSISGNQG